MAYSITRNSNLLSVAFDSDVINLVVSNIKAIHKRGSKVEIVYSYREDNSNKFGTNVISLNYADCTSPTFASVDALETYLLDTTTSSTSSSVLSGILTKWETVGDITYLFYQSRISTAADLEAGVIRRIDDSTGTMTWAGGSDNTFDKTWALRATYTYSPLTS